MGQASEADVRAGLGAGDGRGPLGLGGPGEIGGRLGMKAEGADDGENPRHQSGGPPYMRDSR